VLFEGYYFCHSVPMRNRRPPVQPDITDRSLKSVAAESLDLRNVSQIVKRDGPITYQLLRLVNSPIWGNAPGGRPRLEVAAAGGRVTMPFRRIATMAIASEFNGSQPPELLCMAMVRGRFCEVAGLKRNLQPFEQYLLGLLSLLPAMQGQSMNDLAPALPLDDKIREALMERRTGARPAGMA